MRARARPLILSHLHPARALTTKTTLWTTFSWRQSRNQQTTTTKSSSPSLRKWCYQPPLFCNLRFCDHPVKPDTSEAKLLPPWGTTAQRRKTSKAQLLLPWGITSQRRKKTSNAHLLPPGGPDVGHLTHNYYRRGIQHLSGTYFIFFPKPASTIEGETKFSQNPITAT